jgi:hypothetical protein
MEAACWPLAVMTVVFSERCRPDADPHSALRGARGLVHGPPRCAHRRSWTGRPGTALCTLQAAALHPCAPQTAGASAELLNSSAVHGSHSFHAWVAPARLWRTAFWPAGIYVQNPKSPFLRERGDRCLRAGHRSGAVLAAPQDAARKRRSHRCSRGCRAGSVQWLGACTARHERSGCVEAVHHPSYARGNNA